MTTKSKSRTAKREFHPSDETLFDVVGTSVSIGKLNRNTIMCEATAEGVWFTIICPTSMVTYSGENGPIPVTADSLEILATKQFFEKLRNSTEKDD